MTMSGVVGRIDTARMETAVRTTAMTISRDLERARSIVRTGPASALTSAAARVGHRPIKPVTQVGGKTYIVPLTFVSDGALTTKGR